RAGLGAHVVEGDREQGADEVFEVAVVGDAERRPVALADAELAGDVRHAPQQRLQPAQRRGGRRRPRPSGPREGGTAGGTMLGWAAPAEGDGERPEVSAGEFAATRPAAVVGDGPA